MSCKSAIYRFAMSLFIANCFIITTAQNRIDCQKAGAILPKVEQKMARINTHNPEVISLHYIFVQELLAEVEQYQAEYLPLLHLCEEYDFYATRRRCDTLHQQLTSLRDTLEILRHKVDVLFYQQAVEELNYQDTTTCMYLLDRAIQFNPVQPDALILKLNIRFHQKAYDECIALIHKLYNEAPLARQHENALSDFTAIFYHELFTLGDSLAKAERSSEALTIFETLETFCHDMPTSYCNDDYFHGIIRSKTGIYESYLTIAKVAWERDNDTIAFKFLDYAEQYLAENRDYVTEDEALSQFKEELKAHRAGQVIQVRKQEDGAETKKLLSNPALEIREQHGFDREMQKQYEQLLQDAIQHCRTDQFDEAWIKLKRAREMEKNYKVKVDIRVEILYDELAKYYK